MAVPQGTPKFVESSVPMRDFGGMALSVDPHDTTPGTAQVQVNAVSLRPGELRVRQGYQRVQFDS